MGASTSVVGASGMVKNMAFKTELLPIAGAMVGLISLAASLCFVFFLLVWSGSPITWHFLLLPVVMALQFAFAVALGMWLSVCAVFVRDVIQILPTLLTAIVFVTPIFYSFESMPKLIQMVSIANPFYLIADGYRAIILGNQLPNLVGLAYIAGISAVIFFPGLKVFRRAKGYFDSAI